MLSKVWLPIDARKFGCDVSVRTYVRPYRLWGRGRGRGVPRQPDGEWRIPFFLGGKLHGAFELPAFFLAGSGMTTVAFEKGVFFKSLACLVTDSVLQK